MDIQKLTKEQAVIISGFTGILCGEFSDFHADVEKRLGRGVQTFEFGFKEFSAEVKRLYEADFIEMGTVSKEEAKAQVVPEPSINMTGHDLKYIWDFMDYADPENLDTEVTIQLCKEGFDGAGLYAWVAEYPEEGGIKLGEAQEPAND